MKYIQNDYGQTVISIGEPGSIVTLAVEYPKLINELNSLYNRSHNYYGKALDKAMEMIKSTGICDEITINGILLASHYREEIKQFHQDLGILQETHDPVSEQKDIIRELHMSLDCLVHVVGLTAFKYESQKETLQEAVDIAIKTLRKYPQPKEPT